MILCFTGQDSAQSFFNFFLSIGVCDLMTEQVFHIKGVDGTLTIGRDDSGKDADFLLG